ncbi:1-acyl-sn-glycerol-3-phosphate acyltransferase [Nitzschia inconspicua]|uniref:1-acyl-sn-glycerol-3-phosphate acyltransferase n=1 Tax=Nitzschia inconspicua TaxID=303405 RepID=A0A9K3LLQ8_9STRA|nr:1-acyl-sn-glycerol-3-phosphate acyltransferase [Nitzschia inconspicua]
MRLLSLPLTASSLLVAVATTDLAGAFVPTQLCKRSSSTVSNVANLPNLEIEDAVDTRSFLMSKEDIKPVITLGKGEKEKVINLFGLWCMVVSLLTGPPWMIAMNLVEKLENDKNRELFDMTGKIWAKSWLTMTNSYPTVSGNLERVQKDNNLGPCLYVANHALWLDIPVLCTVLDPVFKFIAKGELSKVPCIGTQLSGGEHILIDRDDRKSQLRTFKETIAWLNKGVPIMAFPEGQRSPDGHLMDFKGGLFLAAVKTKVPIVPITIHHTHAVMPGNSYFPVQSGVGKLHVHIHDAIDTVGKTEEQLAAEVRTAFLKTLPLEQHPLEPIPTNEVAVSLVEEMITTTTNIATPNSTVLTV